MGAPLLEIHDLQKHFLVKKSFSAQNRVYLKAVDGVDLTMEKGETIGRTILKLHSVTGGQIVYEGKDITKYTPDQMMEYRRKMQLIFQDPFASLNPRKTIMQSVEAPLDLSHDIPKAERRERVIKMLDVVGLGEKYLNKYPHELSGGQRQRIVIARALINNPEMVVCDEPVSALDVSVRSQVLNLLKDLQEQMNLAYLFISHDLSVVQYICDKVAVMYLGKIVEIANKEDLFTKPLHPYTKALLSAIPVPDIHHKKPKPAEAAERLPLPHPLPLCDRTLLAGDAAADRRGRQAQGCLPALSGNQQLEKRGGEQRCFISTSANIPICRISITSNTAARRRISPTSPRQAAACVACAWWWRT